MQSCFSNVEDMYKFHCVFYMDLFLVYVDAVQYHCYKGREYIFRYENNINMNYDCVCRLTIGTTVEDAWISWKWVAKCCC